MGAVSMKQRGKSIFEGACGLANVEWQAPNTVDTKFRAASIAKQFTVAAILLLSQEGKLSVGDAVGKHVEDLPETWRPATIHQLLTHTSGIPIYTSDANESKLQRLRRLGATPREILDLVKDAPLMFPHGSKFAYNNTGYILLGLVIEKTSGVPYQQFVHDRIFAPLRMKDTGYDDSRTILPRRASGYVLAGGRLENAGPVDASLPWSSGGFYSTVRDLVSWSDSLAKGALLNPDSTARVFHVYPETLIQGMHYGYAVVLADRFGEKLQYHGGGINGFSSVLQRYPARDLTIAAMSNLDSDSAPVAAWKLADGLAAIVLAK